MRFLKIYGGAILILVVVAALYVIFNNTQMDKEVYNWSLIGCLGLVIVGVLLMIFGGKSADKIGGK
jgi:NADH:ubiquinone oxidoreductase subunit 6 (subunit J)